MDFWVVFYGITLVCVGVWFFTWVRGVQLRSIHRRASAITFLIKVLSSFFLIALYTFYYTDREEADVYKYFDDGAVMESALEDNPADFFKMVSGIDSDTKRLREQYYTKMNHWTRTGNVPAFFNDNQFIIRVNAVMHVLSLHSIWIHGIFFAWLSTLGLILLFKAFARRLHQPQVIAVLLLLMPSLLLWFSGPLKESLLLLGMGLFFHAYLYKQKFFPRLLMLIAGLFLLVSTKLYLLPVFFVFIIFYELFKLFQSPLITSLCVLILLVAASFGLDGTAYAPSGLLAQKQKDFINLARGGFMIHQEEQYFYMPYQYREKFKFVSDSLVQPKESVRVAQTDIKLNFQDSVLLEDGYYQLYFDQNPAQSYFAINKLQPNTWHLIQTAPAALFNALLRPLPNEAGVLGVVNFLENLFIILILGVCVVKLFSMPIQHQKMSLSLLFAVLFTLLLIGWTTPVAGALVRYKAPALFFIIFAFGAQHHQFLKRIKW